MDPKVKTGFVWGNVWLLPKRLPQVRVVQRGSWTALQKRKRKGSQGVSSPASPLDLRE